MYNDLSYPMKNKTLKLFKNNATVRENCMQEPAISTGIMERKDSEIYTELFFSGISIVSNVFEVWNSNRENTL